MCIFPKNKDVLLNNHPSILGNYPSYDTTVDTIQISLFVSIMFLIAKNKNSAFAPPPLLSGPGLHVLLSSCISLGSFGLKSFFSLSLSHFVSSGFSL